MECLETCIMRLIEDGYSICISPSGLEPYAFAFTMCREGQYRKTHYPAQAVKDVGITTILDMIRQDLENEEDYS